MGVFRWALGTFEEFLEKGFPQEYEEVIGEDTMNRFKAAISKLQPLPCMCETGAKTIDQHGSIRYILRRNHPFASIDHSITLGQCTVCKQRLAFSKSGDSHYSYDFHVSLFPTHHVQG